MKSPSISLFACPERSRMGQRGRETHEDLCIPPPLAPLCKGRCPKDREVLGGFFVFPQNYSFASGYEQRKDSINFYCLLKGDCLINLNQDILC